MILSIAFFKGYFMKTDISIMSEDERCDYLKKNWSKISNAITSILRENSKLSKSELQKIVPVRFSKKLILGQGMWGLVLKLNNKKIVAKVTSDILELSLIDIIISTRGTKNDISNHLGIPYIAGSEIFDDINGVIVREDLNVYSIRLSSSNPIRRAVELMIKNYVVPLSSDEMALSDIIKNNKIDTFRDISYAHSILKGNSLKYAKYTNSKIKSVSKKSKSHYTVDFLKKLLLEFGIALVDLHDDNLAYYKHNIEDIFGVKRKKDDFKHYIISDLGLAYDTPIVVADIPIFKKLIESPAIVKKKPLDSIFNRIISLYDKSSEIESYIAKVDYTYNRDSYIRSNPHTNILNLINDISYSYIDRGINFLNSQEFMNDINECIFNFYQKLDLDLDYDRFSSYVISLYKKSLSINEALNDNRYIGFIDQSGLNSISLGEPAEMYFSKKELMNLEKVEYNIVEFRSKLIPVLVELDDENYNSISNSYELITYINKDKIISVQGVELE